MNKNRLEAFSDGVFAILITIMVLELKVPHSPDVHALLDMAPKFMAYTLSFLFLGIYWNNHHHMMHAAHKVNGAILWANLHLLFWLSLVPFATAWMGETGWQSFPVAVYGFMQLASGFGYFLLTGALVRHHGNESVLALAVGSKLKERASVAGYVVAVAVAFWAPWFAGLIYAAMAAMWLIPDRRIEKAVHG